MLYGVRPFLVLRTFSAQLCSRAEAVLRWFGRKVGPFFFVREALVVTALTTLYRLSPALVVSLALLVALQVLLGVCIWAARKRLEFAPGTARLEGR